METALETAEQRKKKTKKEGTGTGTLSSKKRKNNKLTARERAAAATSNTSQTTPSALASASSSASAASLSSSSPSSSSSSSGCRCSANRVICVIAPGAGGSVSSAMLSMLFTPLGSVMSSSDSISFDVRVPSCKWNTRDAGSPTNISQVLAHCQCKSAPSSSSLSVVCNSPLVVFGHSFGCRVLCEMLTRGAFVRPPKAIILMSFPMYPPPPAADNAKKNERVRQLITAFTNGSPPPLLLISGDKDEFLLREYLPHATDARKTMQTAIQPLTKRNASNTATVAVQAVTVEWIEGGLHGLPQCQPRSRTQLAASKMLQIIRTFIASS